MIRLLAKSNRAPRRRSFVLPPQQIVSRSRLNMGMVVKPVGMPNPFKDAYWPHLTENLR